MITIILNRRQTRWFLILAKYDFEIKYRVKKINFVDESSRRSNYENEIDDELYLLTLQNKIKKYFRNCDRAIFCRNARRRESERIALEERCHFISNERNKEWFFEIASRKEWVWSKEQYRDATIASRECRRNLWKKSVIWKIIQNALNKDREISKKELDNYENARAIKVAHRAQDLRESKVKREQKKSFTIFSYCLCFWRNVSSICVATFSSWRLFDETLREQKDFDFTKENVLLTKNVSEHWCIRLRMRNMSTNENVASLFLWRIRLAAHIHSFLNRDFYEFYYEASR